MRKLLVIIICIQFFSCKNESKTTNIDVKNSKLESDKVYKDKEVEDALYNGFFIKNEKGFNISIYNNVLYLFKENATDDFKKNYFFLHVMPKKGDLINLDFSPSEHLLNESLSENYKNLLVYKRELPVVNTSFDINTGQFNNNGRTWESYIQVDQLNEVNHKYNNEYATVTKNNHFLEEFERNLNEGVFMKHEQGFDMSLNDHTLYYIKPKGTESDLKDFFFLHIKVNHIDKIINLDFKAEPYNISKLLGKKYENFIVLKREILTKGDITEMYTGQFDKDKRSWSVAYDIDKVSVDTSFVYKNQYDAYLKQ